MHVLLLLASLLLVVGGGYGALSSLRDLEGWPARRRLQLAVLAAPVFSLAVGSAGLYHNAGRICPLGAPPWDYALGLVAPIVMGVIAVGALGLGLVRFGLMFWTVKRRTVGAALSSRDWPIASRSGSVCPGRGCFCGLPTGRSRSRAGCAGPRCCSRCGCQRTWMPVRWSRWSPTSWGTPPGTTTW